jgi:hypothetical protein
MIYPEQPGVDNIQSGLLGQDLTPARPIPTL